MTTMIRILLTLFLTFSVCLGGQSAEKIIKAGVSAYQEKSLKGNTTLINALENLAENNQNVDAAFLLATAYKNDILEEDKRKNALHWYLLAAQENDHDAELMIGWLYYEGRFYLKKDIKEARQWFKKASDSGLLEATQMLNMLDNL